jgi:hypothetical protein
MKAREAVLNRTSVLCLALLAVACGPQPGSGNVCNAESCDGCCVGSICHQGIDNNACGRGGFACDVCVVEAGQQCIAAACTTAIGGTGGGHAGSGGGMQASGGGAGGGSAGGKKRIFVTAATYSGQLTTGTGAQAAADAHCTLAAQSVNFGGTWIAWLSDGQYSAWSRINDVGPWYLVDGATKVFNNKANMTTVPLTPINMTEQGTRLLSSPEFVWTGSNSGGQPSQVDCNGWTTSSFDFYGSVGNAASTSTWEHDSTEYCSTSHRYYCIEQ